MGGAHFNRVQFNPIGSSIGAVRRHKIAENRANGALVIFINDIQWPEAVLGEGPRVLLLISNRLLFGVAYLFSAHKSQVQ